MRTFGWLLVSVFVVGLFTQSASARPPYKKGP